MKSPFPDFRDVSLLPFGFCSQWERLFQWFVLISYWGNLSLHCSGGSELFYCFYFFPDGKGCVRQYNLECLWESCGWYCFCAFVLPLDWVRDPAEYAVGSPVIPDSVYSSRPSWILSVINFLNFYGGWVQLRVLSQSQILDSMLPPHWFSLRHNLTSWSSPAILFTFYIWSFVLPHSSELNLPPWRPGVFCYLLDAAL